MNAEEFFNKWVGKVFDFIEGIDVDRILTRQSMKQQFNSDLSKVMCTSCKHWVAGIECDKGEDYKNCKVIKSKPKAYCTCGELSLEKQKEIQVNYSLGSCDIHGIGYKTYISIRIANGESYIQSDLCKECFDKYGIEPALTRLKEVIEQ